MNKILSVIIPSYNSKKWIRTCLNSFLCHENSDKLEVIIVDDGSADGSEKIYAEYTQKYPDIFKLVSKENGGHGSAINIGVQFASGKYIKIIDSDDRINTEVLPEFIKLLEKTNADTILTHFHTVNEETGKVKCWKCYPDKFERKYNLDEIMVQWKKFDRCLTFHGITYNRNFYMINAIKLSEKVFYEDHEFATIPCCFSESIVPLDLFVYEYRIGDVNQSVSNVNQVKRISHVETVLKRLVAEKYKLDKYKENSGNVLYYEAKIHHLLLSYLVTSLICDHNNKIGRKRGAEIMKYMKENYPTVYFKSLKHYKILKVMNKLEISIKTYNRILDSKIYNKIRRNYDFS